MAPPDTSIELHGRIEWVPIVDSEGSRGLAVETPTDESSLQVALDTGALISVPRALVQRDPDGHYHFQQAFSARRRPAASDPVIPVVAEELEVSKRSIERERVRVTSLVSTRDEAVDVPLVREELVVERVAVGRAVDERSGPRQEGDTLIVPVYEEVLVVEKRLILKEEVRIRRERQEQRHRERVPLRREDVRIERLPGRATSAAARPVEPGAHRAGERNMARTLVGVFDDRSSAENVLRELRDVGVPQEHVRLMENSGAQPAAGAEEQSWTEKVSSWFSSLFDDDEDRTLADNYAEAWRRGHYLVVADVESSEVDRVANIMNQYGAVDVDQRAEYWKGTGYAGRFDRSAAPYTPEQRQAELGTYRTQATGAAAIPVVQEELSVGKRVVRRAGVRIHSYVEEKPVHEVVRLREERINVERRPVDRPAGPGDTAFQERTIEVSAQGEEPVVEKRARVVEEVVVGRNVEQREEKIDETVRRKDVRIEQVPSSQNIAPESRP